MPRLVLNENWECRTDSELDKSVVGIIVENSSLSILSLSRSQKTDLSRLQRVNFSQRAYKLSTYTYGLRALLRSTLTV